VPAGSILYLLLKILNQRFIISMKHLPKILLSFAYQGRVWDHSEHSGWQPIAISWRSLYRFLATYHPLFTKSIGYRKLGGNP